MLMSALMQAVRVADRAVAGTRALRGLALPATIGGVTFWLAYDGGTYSITARTSLAIVVWWTIIVLTGLGLVPFERVSGGAVVAGGSLAALAALALASAEWSASPERAVTEFDRIALYVGIFVLAVLASSRSNVDRWSDGFAFAIGAIGVIGLVSRLFPGLFSLRGLPTFLPGAVTRLSFPLDYWNGLGIFLGMGVPLLLRASVSASRFWLVRALALGLLPACAAAIYLTSSRGGVAVALVGSLIFLGLARVWSALGAFLVGGIGSALGVAVLRGRHELVNGPVTSAAAVGQGRSAAVWLLAICAASGLVFVAARALVGERLPLGRRLGWVLGAAAAVAVGLGLAFSHPVQRLDAFKAMPGQAHIDQTNFVSSHLLSGNGSGRWQFWQAAIQEFESAPWLGRGAGSYENWWAQHASFSYFIQDAHSLYLETLGEMGVLGLLLLLIPFAVGTLLALRAVASRRGEDRTTIGALTAAVIAYMVGAGIDWMWELTIVTAVGVACLGLLCGPATLRKTPLRAAVEREPVRRLRVRSRFGLGVVTLVLGWGVIAAQASPLLSNLKIRTSQQSSARNDVQGALTAAEDAHKIAPWSADAYLQLALVEEQGGMLTRARASIERAIDRDRRNWRLWVVRARLEVKAGNVVQARHSIDRARELDPLSPLLR